MYKVNFINLDGSVKDAFDWILFKLFGTDFWQRLRDPHQQPPQDDNLENNFIKQNIVNSTIISDSFMNLKTRPVVLSI